MDASGLNPLDIGVIVIVLLSALMAFARGFVREVLSIAAWVGAALAAIWAFAPAQPWLRGYIDNPTIADGLTGFGLFVGFLVVFSVVTHLLASQVDDSALSAVNRSLGFAFGALRGAVIVSLAYLFSLWLWTDSPPAWVEQARTRPLLVAGAGALTGILPQGSLEDAVERARNRIDPIKALETMSDVRPGSGQPQTPEDQRGYSNQDRNRLEQIIKSNPDEPAPAENR